MYKRQGLKWFGVASSGGTRPSLPLDADGLSVLDDHGTPFNKNDDTWQSFTTADGLAVGVVTGIAIDAHGRKWLATGAGGVSVLDDHGTPFDKTDDTWTTYTSANGPVSYTHLRAHETVLELVCRLLLENKKNPITMPATSSSANSSINSRSCSRSLSHKHLLQTMSY